MSTAASMPDNNRMAVERTWLAHERTLMAWVRTATSMIAFGFTVYKFFQFEGGRGAPATQGLLTPRFFALIIVTIGLVSLLLATLAHWKATRTLSAQLAKRQRSLAMVVAGLISGFGLLVLIAAISRS
jgi:putative membrane protein